MGLSLRNSGFVVSPAPGIGLVGMSSNGIPFSVQSARMGVTLLENGAPYNVNVILLRVDTPLFPIYIYNSGPATKAAVTVWFSGVVDILRELPVTVTNLFYHWISECVARPDFEYRSHRHTRDWT